MKKFKQHSLVESHSYAIDAHFNGQERVFRCISRTSSTGEHGSILVLFLTSIRTRIYLCSQSLKLVEFCHYNLSLCICYLSLNKTITTLINSVQKSLSTTIGTLPR